MIEIRQTRTFENWLSKLRDPQAKARITQRISRFQMGVLGDVQPIGRGVSEMRVPYGPGYRVYFVQRGQMLIVLLCGGDKQTQDRDIQHAKALAADLDLED